MLWAWGACVTRRYDLIGVVNHFGSTGSGHYTAYINHCSRPESDTCEWYCYNDNLVTSLTESQLEVGTAVVGDQWTFTLSLPGEAEGEAGADSAILQIVSTQGKAPNRVQVYGGGQRLDCGSVSVSTGGQLFRAG